MLSDIGQGIGKLLAIQLAKLGNTMILWDRDLETVMLPTREIKKAGGAAFGFVVDMFDRESIYTACAKVYPLNCCRDHTV